MAEMLATRFDNVGATWAVYRNLDGTFTQLGNTFAPGVARTSSPAQTPLNLACEFHGGFYVVNEQSGVTSLQIRKLDPSTGAWNVVYTSVNNCAANASAGLWLAKDADGDLSMFTLFHTAGAIRAIRTKDGSTFVETQTGVTLSGNNGSGGWIGGEVYRNTLLLANAKNLVGYTPAGDFTFRRLIGTSANGSYSTAFARAQGRFFCARIAGATASNEFINIYELTGGDFVLLVDGSATTPTLSQANTGNVPHDIAQGVCLHYDPAASANGALILHAWHDRGAAARGWRVFSIDVVTLAVVDLTSTVLATVSATLVFPNADALSANDVHFVVQVDNEASPTAQTVDVWLLTSNGAWIRYRWNGSGSAMTTGGTGGTRNYSMSGTQVGGGQYIYEGSTTIAPELTVEEDGERVPLVAGARIFFKAYTFDETGGAPTDGNADVELRLSGTEQAASVQATVSAVGVLSGPSPAPTLVGNEAQGVTCDNGATVYFMDWDSVTDGFSDQEYAQVMPRIV